MKTNNAIKELRRSIFHGSLHGSPHRTCQLYLKKKKDIILKKYFWYNLWDQVTSRTPCCFESCWRTLLDLISPVCKKQIKMHHKNKSFNMSPHLLLLSCTKAWISFSRLLASWLSSWVNLVCHSLQCCTREDLSGEQSTLTNRMFSTVSSCSTLLAFSVYLDGWTRIWALMHRHSSLW